MPYSGYRSDQALSPAMQAGDTRDMGHVWRAEQPTANVFIAERWIIAKTAVGPLDEQALCTFGSEPFVETVKCQQGRSYAGVVRRPELTVDALNPQSRGVLGEAMSGEEKPPGVDVGQDR